MSLKMNLFLADEHDKQYVRPALQRIHFTPVANFSTTCHDLRICPREDRAGVTHATLIYAIFGHRLMFIHSISI